MPYTLKGRIARAHPYQLDTTLTVYGAGAEASAVGVALKEKIDYTDIVDDLETDDSGRPLAASQAIALVKRMNENKDSLLEDIESVRTDVEQVNTKALEAGAAAENALRVAEEKVTAVGKVVHLPASGWDGNNLTIAVEGITAEQLIIVVADPVSYSPYAECQVRCSGQGENSLTFSCNETPTVDLIANILILE